MRTLHPSIRSALAALFATAAILAFGCNQGHEGDRCNPSLNSTGHDECGGGLICNNAISLCPEAYCCPPVTSDGGLAKSSNPNCQTGCNGGAASICNAGQTGSAEACAFACQNDPGDLTSASTACASPDAGSDASGDGATEASSDAAGDSAAVLETGSEAGDGGHEGSTTDGGAD